MLGIKRMWHQRIIFSTWWLWIVLLWPFPSSAKVVDRVVAVVNDQVITLSELDQAAAPYYQKFLSRSIDPTEREALLERIRHQVLQQLIDEELTREEAKRLGIKVTPAEIESAMENMARENGLTLSEFQERLKAQGIDPQEYRQRLADQLLRLKLVNVQVKGRIVVTDEEIKEYWKKHYVSGHKRFFLQQIGFLVRNPSEEKKKMAKAQAALKELEKGVPFAEVARRYSELPTAKDGGDLGYFDLKDLSPEVREVVKTLTPGEYSGIIKGPGIIQIIRLKALDEEVKKPLSAVKDEIRRKLYQEKVDQRFKQWLKELRSQSYIEVLL
ncbi:hypothetical protein G4V39_00590 [Thermosulfuriphilus ammonigenes]|uniref:Uncharacterized protein n=1 Tax=Thermosulfuriphilus ammonigenes TaxID=1936021 RepID=A0A6G7PTG9_9BACT|nr:SurA N-terminal domain-containing protein [Thermosulfuriphilus ammonigenes]MBA2849241.1 peptidyl-prolyl cis-trans isomerase SurA [Thermosulfuriphilus ammonigenes]QIJ70856.1 hypothetical protein G4V39_00590 [Thermosulfuriphilus ammonigenes]